MLQQDDRQQRSPYDNWLLEGEEVDAVMAGKVWTFRTKQTGRLAVKACIPVEDYGAGE